MKVDYVEEGLSRRHLDVEVPADAVAEAFEQKASHFSRRLKLPGFRKGKIPKELVKSRFRSEILNEVVQDLVPRALERALDQRSLTPLDHPHIGKVAVELGKPLQFRASFEVMPQIEPRDYKGVAATERKPSVGEEEIQKRLESLRERAARYDPVEGRSARDGDYVLGTLHEQPASGPGPARKRESFVLELGSSVYHPALHEKLQGARPGDTLAFEASFPADHPDPRRAGKKLAVRFEVKEIKEKILPPLDDELAKELGELASLAELRDQVRKQAEADARREAQQELRQQLLDKVLEANRFEPPEALVELELDRRIEEVARSLIERGIDPERSGVDWRALREGQRESAARAVRISILLDRISEREGLRESEEELGREIERVATELKRSPEAVRAQMMKEGDLARLRGRLRREKAVDFIKQNARIEES